MFLIDTIDEVFTDIHCCRKGPLIIIWPRSVCVCFGVVESRPGAVTAAVLYGPGTGSGPAAASHGA